MSNTTTGHEALIPWPMQGLVQYIDHAATALHKRWLRPPSQQGKPYYGQHVFMTHNCRSDHHRVVVTPKSIATHRQTDKRAARECRLCYQPGWDPNGAFLGKKPSDLEHLAYGMVKDLFVGHLIVTEWRLKDPNRSVDVTVLGKSPDMPPIAIHVDGKQHNKPISRQGDARYDRKLLDKGVIVVRLHGNDKAGASWLGLLQQAKASQQQYTVAHYLSPFYNSISK